MKFQPVIYHSPIHKKQRIRHANALQATVLSLNLLTKFPMILWVLQAKAIFMTCVAAATCNQRVTLNILNYWVFLAHIGAQTALDKHCSAFQAPPSLLRQILMRMKNE